jgi:ABC-type maltose transport system permease subunit
MRSSASVQRKVSIGVRMIIAIFLIIFAIFPVLWVISASLSATGTLATQTLIPAKPSLDNYRTLLTTDQFPFWTWFYNSIKISTITSVFSLGITTIAAYAFSRFRFRGRQPMLKSIMLINVFPALLALVATFLMISQIGDVLPFIGLDNHTSLILVYLGGAMGVNIWLMKGFLDTIPREIDESAMVEGASHWQIFLQLILPLLRPILIVIAILNYIGTYGDFVGRVFSGQCTTLMVGLRFYRRTISTAMGRVCSWRVTRSVTDYDYLPCATRPNRWWIDTRCSERIITK